MPRIDFTTHLQRHLSAPAHRVPGETVSQALERVFEDNPRLRGYLLDDQGSLREHVTIFVDDQPVADRRALSDPVDETSEIYVVQALSGG